MINILFLSFTLIISTFSFSQNYCQQYQQFKSNSNYGEDQAKENYLGLMCTCVEEGVIDEAQENRILNTLNKYKSYGNIPTKCKKKVGYSSQINLTPSNCQSIAANFRHANGQAQAYGADFLLKKCQCEAGVATAQDERRLLGLMRTVRNQYIAQGGASSDLGAMPTKCGRISENTNRASFNNEFNTDKRSGNYTENKYTSNTNQFSIQRDNIKSLINAIALDTEDENFSNLANKLNKNSENISKIQNSIINQTEYKQGAQEFFDLAENVSFFISIGKSIFEGRRKRREEKALKESLENKKVNEVMAKLSSNILDIRNTFIYTPEFKEYNEQDIVKIDSIINFYSSYDLITSKERLIYIEFLLHDGFCDFKDMNLILSKVSKLSNEQALERIIKAGKIKGKYNEHINNFNIAFQRDLYDLNLTKAVILNKMGKKREADEIKQNLNLGDARISDMIIGNYLKKNYQNIGSFSAILHEQIVQQKKEKKLTFSNSGSYYKKDELDRTDINFLLAIGVESGLKTNNFKKAREVLFKLKSFQENYDLVIVQATNKESLDYEKYKLSKLIALTIETYFNAYNNKNLPSSFKELNLSILDANKNKIYSRYEAWIKSIRLEIALENNMLEEARKYLLELKILKKNRWYSENFLNEELIDFSNCFIRYKKNDYQGALMAIKIYKMKHNINKKILRLEQRIYIAQNNLEQSEITERELIKLLSDQ